MWNRFSDLMLNCYQTQPNEFVTLSKRLNHCVICLFVCTIVHHPNLFTVFL